MKKIEVSMVELAPMKVLSFLGYGESPESIAWEKTHQWMKKNEKELFTKKLRIFGFNNPCPSAGSKNYGYEFWISGIEDYLKNVKDSTQDSPLVKEFPGGFYATCPMQTSTGEEIPSWWAALNAWCETSPYTMAHHQWLEEHSMEGWPFSLWLPIIKLK